jgi:glycosyltransferase involved in cell wall biosynthesis
VRVSKAAAWLEEADPDLVYVNSLGAADWLGAARRTGHRSVLHVHEMMREISMLLLGDVFESYDVTHAARVLAASRECMKNVQSAFGIPSDRISNFGVCVDVTDIERRSKEAPPRASRHDGGELDYENRGERKIIAMCGLAQHRKGADLFWESARMAPEFDFLWIGPWDDSDVEVVTNPALPLNSATPLDNLYWTNVTTNPYSAMSRADLFTLTSREDPNPLVVPEAIALGRPVLTFADTGGAHEWTSRYGLCLSGAPEPQRLADFARRFFSMEQLEWRPAPEFFHEADLETKTR